MAEREIKEEEKDYDRITNEKKNTHERQKSEYGEEGKERGKTTERRKHETTYQPAAKSGMWDGERGMRRKRLLDERNTRETEIGRRGEGKKKGSRDEDTRQTLN